MPIFEYQCQSGHITERLVSLVDVDDPKTKTTTCDQCDHEGELEIAERVLSATKTTFRHADRRAFKS